MAKKGNISHFLHFFFCVAKYWSNEAVLPLKILWRFPYVKSFCCSAVKMVGPSTMPAMNWGKEAVGSPLFVWKYWILSGIFIIELNIYQVRKLGGKCDPYFEKSYILERPINQTSWEAWQVVDVAGRADPYLTESKSTLSLYLCSSQLKRNGSCHLS